MRVLLDENNYYTGNYVTIGDIEGAKEVNKLPEYEDVEKQMSCKYENGEWIYDENKYQEIQETKKQEEKKQKIAGLQAQLDETDYKIIKSSEYQLAGLELPYDIEELHRERQALRDKINELEE